MKTLIISNEILTVVGIKNILEENFDKVVFENAMDKEDVIKILKTKKFDLIIFHLFKDVQQSLSIFKILKTHSEQPNILVIGDYQNKANTLRYMSLGAIGFIVHSAGVEDIVMAAKMVSRGNVYLSKEALTSDSDKSIEVQVVTSKRKLSKKEEKVMELLIQDYRVKDICKVMEVHQSTVSTLKKRIFAKLGVDNLESLKNEAIELGF